VLEESHGSFIEAVPFKIITTFTLFQALYLAACFGITWIPLAGVLFPLLIMLLVPVRRYILPKFFKAAHLQELDRAEYEEVAPMNHVMAMRVCITLINYKSISNVFGEPPAYFHESFV
jgi:hypothetical protein